MEDSIARSQADTRSSTVDDVLAITVLSVVASMIGKGVQFALSDAILLVVKTLLLFGLLLGMAVLMVPRLLHLERL